MDSKWKLFAFQLLILPAFLYSDFLQSDLELLATDIISGECGSCGSLVNYARKEIAFRNNKILSLEGFTKQEEEVQAVNNKELTEHIAEELKNAQKMLIKMKQNIIELELIVEMKSQELAKLSEEQSKQLLERAEILKNLQISSEKCETKKIDSIKSNGILMKNLREDDKQVSQLLDNLKKCQRNKAGLGYKLSWISRGLLSKMFNLFESINEKEGNILGLGLFNELYASNAAGPGWLIILRRVDDIEDFNRPWQEYVDGFGNVKKGFWFGLEKIYKLTKERRYELFIEILDSKGVTHYTKYDNFKIGDSAAKYPLESLGNSTGNIADLLDAQLGKPFSTPNSDNSNITQCPHTISSGWWYADCEKTHLTDNKLNCDQPTFNSDGDCVLNKGSDFSIYPIKYVQMMIRPFKSHVFEA